MSQWGWGEGLKIQAWKRSVRCSHVSRPGRGRQASSSTEQVIGRRMFPSLSWFAVFENILADDSVQIIVRAAQVL